MKKRKFTTLEDSLVITLDNVQTIGEKIAVCAVQNAKRYAYGALDKLYRGLLYDIQHDIPVSRLYSDGYDIAQEAICFLCHFIGHQLGEICIKNIHGKYECIRLACYKHLYCYLRKQKKIINDERDIDLYTKIVNQTELDKIPQDFKPIYKLIKQLKLDKQESQIVLYLADGLTCKATAEFVNISTPTLRRKRTIIKQKMIDYYN